VDALDGSTITNVGGDNCLKEVGEEVVEIESEQQGSEVACRRKRVDGGIFHSLGGKECNLLGPKASGGGMPEYASEYNPPVTKRTGIGCGK
jgi:hypothetical protein